MNCNICKIEMIENTCEGDKYHTCPKCGDVKLSSQYDKK
jgi:hypothetical protein